MADPDLKVWFIFNTPVPTLSKLNTDTYSGKNSSDYPLQYSLL